MAKIKKGIAEMKLEIEKTLQAILGSIKGHLSNILSNMIKFFLSHLALKASVLFILRKFPSLLLWLHGFAAERGMIARGISVRISSNMPLEQSELTCSARLVYVDLKAAIERHNKGGY